VCELLSARLSMNLPGSFQFTVSDSIVIQPFYELLDCEFQTDEIINVLKRKDSNSQVTFQFSALNVLHAVFESLSE
ncbi:hypothetical protein PFISCL1PPCAC_2164, partial [Pristionchus fissidentatus]